MSDSDLTDAPPGETPRAAGTADSDRAGESGIARGLEVLRSQIRTLPASPGVYRMLNAEGEALYVGKARNLKRRVTNYTQLPRLPLRLQRMVAETEALEVVTTHTEAEALLLESNLIKRLRPRYNVLLRDDKSFPYILLTARLDRQTTRTGADPRQRGRDADTARRGVSGRGADPVNWPGITKYRGARTAPGEYFGPFASAGAVNRTLNALERAFLLRSCSDSIFAGRTRPCLKYQLKRCSAPCVGRIERDEYERLIAQARDFLSGRSHEVQQELAAAMQAASDRLDFEAAARFRDRLRALAHVQSHQDINLEGLDLRDTDVVAAWQDGGQTCIQVFFFRGGRNYGNRAYYPRHDRSIETADVLAAFLGQFYEDMTPPHQVLTNCTLPERELIAEALSVRAGRKVALSQPQRGPKRNLVEHAAANARDALARRLAETSTNRTLLDRLAETFGLDGAPERIEVYDNSHVSGTNAVGAMIVAGPDGFTKNAYRKFNIRGDKPAEGDGNDASDADAAPGAAEAPAPYAAGDDYAMMREVLTRRFARAQREDPERSGAQWPDLVLIDGGQGQLNIALDVLADLGIDDVAVVGIAKGPDRNAGRERLFMPGKAPFSLPERDPLLYYLQRLRDEAHRFAIGTHRARRSKAIGRNPLDEIPGVGARRKRALLNHFGSARAVAQAGLGDLEKVEGISGAVATRVYEFFHGDK
jgi:excinuclease ABC subunit C